MLKPALQCVEGNEFARGRDRSSNHMDPENIGERSRLPTHAAHAADETLSLPPHSTATSGGHRSWTTVLAFLVR